MSSSLVELARAEQDAPMVRVHSPRWPSRALRPGRPAAGTVVAALVALAVLLLPASTLRAAGTPTGATDESDKLIMTPAGVDQPTTSGEFITNSVGGGTLNTYYRFFIEVPPSTSRIRVQLFDPDHGGTNDTGTTATFSYTLFDPSGAQQATILSSAAGPAASNNAWFTLFDTTTTLTAGHWELRIDATTNGQNINGVGVRADDGNATSGGTELKVYYHSYFNYGLTDSGQGDRVFVHYPWVTSGCSCSENDFDAGNQVTLSYSSRTNLFAATVTEANVSGNNAWNRDTLTFLTQPTINSVDYGLWTQTTTVQAETAGQNYVPFYMGNYTADANPPSAQPEANTVRVYLPSDGSTPGAEIKPTKPYMEQQVRYVGAGGGPNPPVVGSTTRYRVTVRFVNPTAFPVTFSSDTSTGNRLTVFVPGGVVTYGGNLTASAGHTSVSAPGVGGSGTITWAPGVVAAGETILLSYDVRVTPTAPLQATYTVTGTTASNGTRGTYVDETGNTTQTAATYTFGPLCQLAVRTDAPTAAVVSDVRLRKAGRDWAVEWSTVSEAGTLGFEVHRQVAGSGRKGESVKVHAGTVPALAKPAGGTYRVLDAGLGRTEGETYTIVELEASGLRRVHGPFSVKPESEDGPALPASGVEAKAHEATMKPVSPKAGSGGGGSALRAKVETEGAGIFRVTAASLAGPLGMSEKELVTRIRAGSLSVSRAGQPVAWTPSASGDALLIYAEAADSIYTKRMVYWVAAGPGSLMGQLPAPAGEPGSVQQSQAATVAEERDLLEVLVLPMDPTEDYWFWDWLLTGSGGYDRKSFDVTVTQVAAGAGVLRVELYGARAGGHHVAVALNGVALGSATWSGYTRLVTELPVPAGVLREGTNTVELTALLDPGVSESAFYVDSFRVRYPRTFRAAGPALAFEAAGSGLVVVTGLPSADVQLFEVTDARSPRRFTGFKVLEEGKGSWQVVFNPPAASGKFVATTTAGLGAPSRVSPDHGIGLRQGGAEADYVVLTSADLLPAAQQLAAYRQTQGLRPLVATVEAIYDEFADGEPTPDALRGFVEWTRTTWLAAPRYLLLAGWGSYDYKDFRGFGGNHVPALMDSTTDGLYPWDNGYATQTGGASPWAAVGRIPARTLEEMSAYVEKVRAYEAGADAKWVGAATLVADDPQAGIDFGSDSRLYGSRLPAGFGMPEEIFLGPMDLPTARASLLAALNAGRGHVAYVGHGAMTQLPSEGLLKQSDVAGLAPTAGTPILTALTCVINRFGVPGYLSLGETLVTRAGAGTVATWAPSGLSDHWNARDLGDLFASRVWTQEASRLGDGVLQSLQDFQSAGGLPQMTKTYTLLGDPAVVVQHPAPPPPSGGGNG